MMINYNDDQMIFGVLGGLKLPDICLTGEGKKTRKKLPQEICPDRGSKPGLLRDKRACYRLAHIYATNPHTLEELKASIRR